MLLLNVKKCGFVMYAIFFESLHVVNIDFDEKFALDMISSGRSVYMENIIHNICVETGKE